MYFVHWVWNCLDLSMDAVIKYFASGFFLCTGMSILYEMILSLLASAAMFLVTMIGAIGLILIGNDSNVITFQQAGDDGFENDDDDHDILEGLMKPTVHLPVPFSFVLAIVTAFVNAFLVAALVEEISKYLSFYMVEHPDLERDSVVLLPRSDPSKTSNTDRSSNDATDVDGDVADEANELSKLVMAGDNNNNVSAVTYNEEVELIASPVASLASTGAATTIAMVATALGFACAENLLYVFAYTPPGLDAELSTLMIRCLFPIHPLAAGLQSIGVVRRDLERDASVGVGRIILPAWILHGSFDFSLMAFSLVSQIISKSKATTDKGGTSVLFDSIFSTILSSVSVGEGTATEETEASSFVISFVFIIPVIGAFYYFHEAWAQRERLEALDRRNGIQPW
jgi:PrsW family intramembrane metalloprotease